jgi:hypothetical protein
MYFTQFSPDASLQWLQNLIRTYQEVFAGPPWYELEWTAEQIQHDLEQELAKPGAICRVAGHVPNVAGFCWGYPVEIGDFEKLLNLSGIDSAIGSRSGSKAIVYLDEIGMHSKQRHAGMAAGLLHRWLGDYADEGFRYVVLRTAAADASTNQVPVAYSWFSRLGFEVLDRYGADDSRVVMGRNLDNELVRSLESSSSRLWSEYVQAVSFMSLDGNPGF